MIRPSFQARKVIAAFSLVPGKQLGVPPLMSDPPRVNPSMRCWLVVRFDEAKSAPERVHVWRRGGLLAWDRVGLVVLGGIASDRGELGQGGGQVRRELGELGASLVVRGGLLALASAAEALPGAI